jgi:uncharacterized protein with GYD domain
MARYVIMSNLTDEGAKTIKKNPGRIKEVDEEINKMGIKILDQYAVLGDYDFITIVEAEDDAITKMVVELFSRGTIKTTTYKLIPIDSFIESLK